MTDKHLSRHKERTQRRTNMSKQKSKLTYVITGGCGFLGQHLLRVLLEKEENIKEIRLFDKNVFPSLQSHSTGKKHVKQTVHYDDYELVSAHSHQK